ncbi:MAG: hypothetical protein PWQ57_2601 [Desulfovibrionales bacterium]|jgi:hypothetical protein|nr:hypothetical protein [Desulfovibrionales bacterium]
MKPSTETALKESSIKPSVQSKRSSTRYLTSLLETEGEDENTSRKVQEKIGDVKKIVGKYQRLRRYN